MTKALHYFGWQSRSVVALCVSAVASNLIGCSDTTTLGCRPGTVVVDAECRVVCFGSEDCLLGQHCGAFGYCEGEVAVGGSIGTCVDRDGDGYGTQGSRGCEHPEADCNDSERRERPGATEICDNGIDDDCDDLTDRDDADCDPVTGTESSWWRDLDGDGLGDINVEVLSDTQPLGYVSNSDDCDDRLETCTLDCGDAGDGDGVADCVEIACGTDPDDLAETCVVFDGSTHFEALVEVLNATTTRAHVLIATSVVLDSPISLTSPYGIEVRAAVGATITTNAHEAIYVDSQSSVLEGLTIVATTGTPIFIKASNVLLTDCDVSGFTEDGIVVQAGHGVRLIGNFIHDGVPGAGSFGAIRQRGGTPNLTIADNIVADIGGHCIRLGSVSSGLILDHNTLVRCDSAVSVHEASGICMRNNLIRSVSQTVSANDYIVFVEEIRPGIQCSMRADTPTYGNSASAYGNRCGGNACEGCVCVPQSFFQFVDVDPALDADFCIGDGNPHIDASHADLGYDLNGGDMPGNSVGVPDIGAQEWGAGQCQ